jgi:hypothetical protein
MGTCPDETSVPLPGTVIEKKKWKKIPLAADPEKVNLTPFSEMTALPLDPQLL